MTDIQQVIDRMIVRHVLPNLRVSAECWRRLAEESAGSLIQLLAVGRSSDALGKTPGW